MISQFSTDTNYLIMIGPVISCLWQFSVSFLLFPLNIPTFFKYFFAIFCYFANNSCALIPLAVLWSKFSRHFVDGFETTGATILIGIYDFGVLSSYWISDKIFRYYNIQPGYFSRLKTPIILFCSAEIFLSAFSFLFLFKKPITEGLSFTAAMIGLG